MGSMVRIIGRPECDNVAEHWPDEGTVLEIPDDIAAILVEVLPELFEYDSE